MCVKAPPEYYETGRTKGMMHEYLVIFEPGADGGWSAYVPDLPGLGVVGESREEADQLIREGIVIHIAGLREDGLPIPDPTTIAARVTVAVAVAA
jgi:predicted RNase H-like HicB family nuclease